jgi:hypothetical protein
MAYGALVERSIPVPRAKVYALLADWGGIGKLMGEAVESCTLEGDGGVGSIRRVRAAGVPGDLVERLEVAYPGRVISYSIVEECSLPIDHYCAVVTLDDAPGGGCAIAWGSNWVPKGAPEDTVRRMLTGLYGSIIDALERAGAR